MAARAPKQTETGRDKQIILSVSCADCARLNDQLYTKACQLPALRFTKTVYVLNGRSYGNSWEKMVHQ